MNIRYLISSVFMYFILSTLSLLPIKASDLETFEENLKKKATLIYRDISQQDPENIGKIASASIEVLETLKNWNQETPPPKMLPICAGAAFGQLSYCSPFTCQFYDSVLLPYIQNGQLSYNNLRPPYYKFRFGLRAERHSQNPDTMVYMKNGQIIDMHYFLNDPLFFNRLFCEFKGDSLLIGGGEKCECGNGPLRHPKDHFYHIDIDNAHLPDLVMHADYLEHLYAIPSERFSFIWIEHCTIAGLYNDASVLEQYFRVAKSGALFVFQSNFILINEETLRIYDKAAENLKRFLARYKFAALEESIREAIREGEKKKFRQIIFMKAFKKSVTPELISCIPKINIEEYREPNAEERTHGLENVQKFLS